jgi:glutamine synthetase
MAETQLLPSIVADLGARAGALAKMASVGLEVPESLKSALQVQAHLAGVAQERIEELRKQLAVAESVESLHARTVVFGHQVRQAQDDLRDVLDSLEESCDADLWPVPKYREMLAPLS